MEVQRILHQRALNVKLDPELQKCCMTDLGKWCSEKTDPGQELECLQDHLEDLVSDCRDVVGNLTELESEVTPHLLLPIMQHTMVQDTCRRRSSDCSCCINIILPSVVSSGYSDRSVADASL